METKKKQKELLKALSEVTSDSCVGAIENAFRRMAIAEDEISRGQQRHPNHSDKIFAMFRHLCPTPMLRHVPDEVFRAHCRELIERVANDEDIQPGTNAELLAFLSKLSLESALDRVHFLLYQQLFHELLPSQAAALGSDGQLQPPSEQETRQMNDLQERYRRNLASERTPQ